MGLFDFITAPTSYRNAQAMASFARRDQVALASTAMTLLGEKLPPHSQHPNFGHLTLLVFEAVLEVVCVSLPGYLVARQGLFDAESQKFLANLNVTLFTPCLIFTKLASQLTAEKLVELAIIPFIFVVQTLISYLCAWGISRGLGLKKRQKNFIIAMGVFGNSNSLPISLVISLSQTLRGLHWDKIPNDNDDEVGARGILYLLIFQQLGQLLRWSWGYNVLLAPAEKYSEEDGGTGSSAQLEQGGRSQTHDPEDDPRQPLIGTIYEGDYDSSDNADDERTRVGNSPSATSTNKSSRCASPSRKGKSGSTLDLPATPANGNVASRQNGHLTSFAQLGNRKDDEPATGFKGIMDNFNNRIRVIKARTSEFISSNTDAVFAKLPRPVQSVLTKINSMVGHFFEGLWEFMNPPLWAMLVAIMVASVPALQRLFFDDGTFIRNSVTRAISQSGGVAVPLILVVLGGNLARNTLPKETGADYLDPKEERKLLVASLVSRMLLPTILMAPLLALIAKYVPVSIVDDKIFVIVCFLLTGAPTALQLAQICQVNNVYMSVMSKILFQSYVVWILPSTLILVMAALEVVEWATY